MALQKSAPFIPAPLSIEDSYRNLRTDNGGEGGGPWKNFNYHERTLITLKNHGNVYAHFYFDGMFREKEDYKKIQTIKQDSY